MNITRALLSDAPAILELQKEAYQSEAALHDDFNIPPLTQTLEELERSFDTHIILKVEKEGVLIGSGQARCENGTCYIGRMAISPKLQGQGLGSKLLNALENSFDGIDRLELYTGEKSLANLAMYERRGYRRFKTASIGKTTIIYLEKTV